MKPATAAVNRAAATISEACTMMATTVSAGMTMSPSIGARSNNATFPAAAASAPPNRASDWAISHRSIQAVPAARRQRAPQHDRVSRNVELLPACGRGHGRRSHQFILRHAAGVLPGTLDLLILKAVSLGAPARLRRAAPDSADLRRGARRAAGLPLSGAQPVGAPGFHRIGMGRERQPAPRQVLPLTRAGRRRFQEDTAGWERLAVAMQAALSATPDGA